MATDDPAGELRRIAIEQAKRTVRAVYLVGEDLLGQSVQLAPKDEGTLRGSATLTMLVNGARYDGEGSLEQATAEVVRLVTEYRNVDVSAEVSFNTPYAARQHEETDWHHTEGQAKYLEGPLRASASRYGAIITAAATKPIT